MMGVGSGRDELGARVVIRFSGVANLWFVSSRREGVNDLDGEVNRSGDSSMAAAAVYLLRGEEGGEEEQEPERRARLCHDWTTSR
jgi:hypothetical protein